EGPIEERDAAGTPPSRRREPLLVDLAGGEDEEDEADDEGHVDAAMRRLAQETETGRVVMECRQREEQPRDQPRPTRLEGAEAHLRIELLLERPALGPSVKACIGHRRTIPLVGASAAPCLRCSRAGAAPGKKKPSAGQGTADERRGTGGGPDARRASLTSGGRLPCRTSRRPDGRECPRRR